MSYTNAGIVVSFLGSLLVSFISLMLFGFLVGSAIGLIYVLFISNRVTRYIVENILQIPRPSNLR